MGKNAARLTTPSRRLTTGSPRLATLRTIPPGGYPIFELPKSPEQMNAYKIKSLIYLLAFAISALVYNQMTPDSDSDTLDRQPLAEAVETSPIPSAHF